MLDSEFDLEDSIKNRTIDAGETSAGGFNAEKSFANYSVFASEVVAKPSSVTQQGKSF